MSLPTNRAEAAACFADENWCRTYVAARRWPDGIRCPVCLSTRVYHDECRKGWECKTRHPKRRFTLKTGTAFEDSSLGMDKWLTVIWMIANARRRVTARDVARATGVTQKTGWFVLHRIRLAMEAGAAVQMRSGHR